MNKLRFNYKLTFLMLIKLFILFHSHQAAMFELYEKKRISIFKITDPDPSKFDADVIFRNTIMVSIAIFIFFITTVSC